MDECDLVISYLAKGFFIVTKKIRDAGINRPPPLFWAKRILGLTRLKQVRFMIVGITNTALGLGIIYLLAAFGASPIVANATAYFLGLILSFTLNKRWTFGHSGDVIASATRFLIVFVIAYFFNLIVVVTAIGILGLDHHLAQALGIPPFTLVFYLGVSAFALRPSAASKNLRA